MNAYQKLD